MKTANDYKGLTDSDILEAAVKSCKNGIVYIPKRKQENEPERDWWLIDRAILIPDNTTIVLQDVKVKLSDKCRDNFFRSANCGLGIEDIREMQNIHIHGEGHCVLEGADHPRATGDGSKRIECPCPKEYEDMFKYAEYIPEERRKPNMMTFEDVHGHSYGTDAGKEGESQYGDWRGIGILLANVKYFSIENIKIICSHGWGISLEACTNGRIERIEFDACMTKEIDGMLHNTENQDGIDLRNGCHDIIISDISGGTGDDVIALTAIAAPHEFKPSGSLRYTHVMHNDWTKRDTDIHDIIIKNVCAYSKGHVCSVVRLLPAHSKIYNVVIDNIIDSAPEGFYAGATFILGDDDGGYGKNFKGSMRNIAISNAICHGTKAVMVSGYLCDSVLSNIINTNPECAAITYSRDEGLTNVATNNIISTNNRIIEQGRYY